MQKCESTETFHTSSRLKLELLTVAHAVELFPLLTDSRIYEYIAVQPPVSVEALAERYRNLESRLSPDGSQRWLNWVIRRTSNHQCVGYLQATIYPDNTANFAFVLGLAFWGLGLAREASLLALHSLFAEHGVTQVFATTDRKNVRSSTLLNRLGFVKIQPASYPHGRVLPSDYIFQLKRNV